MHAYNQGNWRLIQSTVARLSEDAEAEEKLRKAMNNLTETLETVRNLEMIMNCRYRVDGYCSFWRYREKPEIFGQADERIKDEFKRTPSESKINLKYGTKYNVMMVNS